MVLFLNPLLTNITDSSSDEVIIEKYLASQKGAYFDILFKRYSAKVYARCISMLKNEALAQDAVQDVFIKVLTSLSKFNGKSKFSSWLYSITYNYCIDHIRRNKNKTSIPIDNLFDLEAQGDNIDDKILMETKYSQLKVIMDVLPEKDKAVLLMKYQDGMSIKAICQNTDRSESAIKMQIKRAKQRFQLLRNQLFPEAV